jgi:hypothetical protein
MAQTTIHVGPGQTYTTIQSGIDAANYGDIVLVAPGTYTENIDFKGKAITVTSSGGAAQTILDGGSVGPAVIFQSGETSASTISGFTIQHGGSFGTNGSSPSLPGGIYLEGSSPKILKNIITLSNCWGINSNYSAPLIQNNTISATQDPHGNCSFGGGAAIIVWGGIDDQYNSSGINSGVILGNIIENNVESGLEDAGGNGGAGVAVWGGTPIIEDNIIRNNASPGGSGGAINFINSRGTLIAQNLIYGNSAGCGGGAIATDGQGLYVINNTIVDNVGVGDWGFSECASIAQIYPSPDSYGQDDPADVFINNIISGSTSYPAVNCSWFSAPNEANQPTFQNNILYNAGGPFFGTFCVDVSDKYNNHASDPQFVDPTTQDYHLKSTSPAIDSGQNSVLQTFLKLTGLPFSKDFDGKPRVQDATGKGCVIDMGAYEYPGTVSECGVSETLTSSLNPAKAGQTVTFTAQLTAASGTPTGDIQFLDGSNLVSTQTVSGKGSAAFSTSSLAVGSHTITANYRPTGSFGATTASLTQVIEGDATSTSLTCQPNPIDAYGAAQLTATVTSANGTPTGSIQFTQNSRLLATQSLLNGTTTLAFTPSVAETYTLTANYLPTGPFAASSATCIEVVNLLPTSSSLKVAPLSANYGTPVKLVATVFPVKLPAPASPTGTVTFYNGTVPIVANPLMASTSSLVTSFPGGSHTLTCTYNGDAAFAASNCNSVQIVIDAAPTALTLTSSKNPATYLSPITFTARLTFNGQSAGAGNTLHLSLNGQTVSLTTDANGSATYTIDTLPPNTYPVTVSSTATNNFLASSASLTEVVTAAPTAVSLTGAPNPGDLHQAITFVATVSSPATSASVGGGSVAFYDGAASLGSSELSAAGTASLTTGFSALGVHNITAMYEGDADFSRSTSAVFEEKIVAGDFSIQVKPGAASVYTGVATAVQVSVASLRGFNQPLALSCAGLPANSTCSFSPASLPQGQGAANLVIQTTAPHKAGSVSSAAAAVGALMLFLLPGWRRRRGLLAGLCAALLAVGLGMGLAGCGSPSPITGGSPPGTYQVAVTATAPGGGTALTHSAVVTLTVKSLF